MDLTIRKKKWCDRSDRRDAKPASGLIDIERCISSRKGVGTLSVPASLL